MSTILEPDIDQAEYRGQYVEPLGREEFHHTAAVSLESQCEVGHGRATSHGHEAHLVVTVLVGVCA